LDLAQIEAIVQEIEQEKEAGKIHQPSNVPTWVHCDFHSRGGEEALEVGCHGGGASGDGKPCREYTGIMRAMAVLCNYMRFGQTTNCLATKLGKCVY
jgi:hypothetical protein